MPHIQARHQYNYQGVYSAHQFMLEYLKSQKVRQTSQMAAFPFKVLNFIVFVLIYCTTFVKNTEALYVPVPLNLSTHTGEIHYIFLSSFLMQ